MAEDIGKGDGNEEAEEYWVDGGGLIATSIETEGQKADADM